MSDLFGMGRGVSLCALTVLMAALPLNCGGEVRTYGSADGGDSSDSGTGGGGKAATNHAGSATVPGEGGAGDNAGTGNEGGGAGEAGDDGQSAAGEGGAAGTGGTSGTGGMPGCTFVSAEDCFNGKDDDCNGAIDAADSACTSVTQCVPAASAFSMGILLGASGTCPSAFSNAPLALNRTLNGPACTGCSCTATVQCKASVYAYSTLAQCTSDTALTGGTYKGDVGPTDMCLDANPLISGPGFRVGPYTTTSGACVPAGTPAVGAPTWGASAKFCGTNLVGAGCSPGNVSIPKTTEKRCVVASGSKSCPTGYLPETNPWYLGYTDQRTCSACTCGTQTPGDCKQTATGSPIQVTLYFGTSQTCSAGSHRSAGSNAQDCTVLDGSGPHNSMGFSSASPKAPTCPPVSTVSGALTPTSEYTLCCAL